MNRKTLTAFLAMGCLAFCGCIIDTGPGGGGSGGGGGFAGNSGDVTFGWTFAGQACSANPDIASVQVTISGQQLMNAGVYPCISNGFPGIVLHDFDPGAYTFTLTANDANNTTLFAGSGRFTVDGDIMVSVDLVPTGGSNSYAYLSWTFPADSASPNPSCAQAGVETVGYLIDSGATVTANCADGFGAQAVQTSYLPSGNHTLTVSAFSHAGVTLYSYSGTLQTFAGNPVSVGIPFVAVTGGAVVRWTIEDSTGTQTLSCAQAGITSVFVNFSADGTHWLYEGAGDERPCADNGVVYSDLPAGPLAIYVAGLGSGSVNYLTSNNPSPAVTVTAGVYPDGTVDGAGVASVIIRP